MNPTRLALLALAGLAAPLAAAPIAQQAYLKASNTRAGDNFGRSVAVSGDTMVVGAPYEDSTAMGVSGGAADSGAVYVFIRDGATWRQQAYLKAGHAGAGDLFGFAVAISGETLVVGAHGEDSNARVVNGNADNDGAPDAGAAYVFIRTGTTWTQQAYLKAANSETLDAFGISVAISNATVVIGAYFEDSDAPGVDGDATNNNAPDSGAAYVFGRNGAVWTQQAYLKASNTESGDNFGTSVAISGGTILAGAQGENSNATGVDGNGGNDDAFLSGAAYVFVRNGTTWAKQAYLKASNTGGGDLFGRAVALSGDTAVIGAMREDSSATGIDGNQNNDNSVDSGAAYVFIRSGAAWAQQAYLKPSNTRIDSPRDYWFGTAVAISGDSILVGARRENSNGIGVNGDQGNVLAVESGAGYLFGRSNGGWRQKAYLKARNSGAHDQFGFSVSLSGDTAAIGAPAESSSTMGVDSTPNEGASGAGAAYVFTAVANRGEKGALKIPLSVFTGVDIGFAAPPASVPQQAFVFGGGGWAAGEEPEKVADERTSTVYGNLGGTNSGLAFFAAPFDQITFYTRGNPLDADPIQYTLWGRVNPAPDNTSPPSYLLSTSFQLAAGTLAPPSNGPGVLTVTVPPIPSVSTYILTFADLRGPSKAKMQIAEIALGRSAPRWDSPAVVSNPPFFEINGLGIPGFDYTFYRNETLRPGEWTRIGDARAAASGKFFVYDLPGIIPQKFYRIVEKGVSIAP